MSVIRRSALVLLAVGLAAPTFAADPGAETTSVRVFRPTTASPHATRSLQRRIAAAALEACGATGFSVAEAKAAVARSQCWRDSYAGGIAQIDDGASRTAAASLPPPSSTGRP